MGRRAEDVVSGEANGMRERLLSAAKECFERHGIAKTAIEDIAKAAGVSRPTVYKYLGDRNKLILTLVVEEARVVVADARRVMERHSDFPDKIVEGILYTVEQTRDHPFLGVLVSPEHLDLASQIIAVSEATVELNVELWMPVLKAARDRGELRRGLKLHDVCVWLSQVEFIMVGRAHMLPTRRSALRKMLRTFVLPALVPDEQRVHP